MVKKIIVCDICKEEKKSAYRYVKGNAVSGFFGLSKEIDICDDCLALIRKLRDEQNRT